MDNTSLFTAIARLNDKFEQDKRALLEQYKVANQKYPIGFTFPFKGETAKINRSDVYLDDDEYRFDASITYLCYVPSICNREILAPYGGKMTMGDSKDSGVKLFQIEIDQIVEA